MNQEASPASEQSLSSLHDELIAVFQNPLNLPQLQQPQMLTYIQIPSWGKQGALTIDIKKPWQLIQFFKDLELLFMQGGMTSKAEKKEMVLRYVELELEEVWGWYPDFKDQTKTYNDFKDAILAHYPESSGKFLYSLSDIDILVGDRFRRSHWLS